VQPLARVCAPWMVLNVHGDRQNGFDAGVRQLSGNWYLHGWWQSQEYFAPIRPVLRREFELREGLSGRDLELQKRIESCNAVCVHVRRGDIVSSPRYSKIYRALGWEYFGPCVAEMRRRVDKPHFFVFSDDPQWCRENITGADFTHVDQHDGATDYVDFALMSRCRHFVTANSTFSWWAAWLGDHPGKIVIVPPTWRLDMPGTPPGLIPPQWQLGPEAGESRVLVSA